MLTALSPSKGMVEGPRSAFKRVPRIPRIPHRKILKDFDSIREPFG